MRPAEVTLGALEAEVAEVAAPMSARAFLLDVLSLTKPRLSGLVMFTTAGGMWLSGRQLSFAQWAVMLVATAGTVGSANAFNCFMERDSDRFMARTATRPLPAGRMEGWFALLFAVTLGCMSVPALFIGVNTLTGLLGLLALLSYVLVYTPLKSRTHWAMLAGAVPGALPPLMGWTAATGEASQPGWALFAILFFWQLPHFIAIALFRKDEYRKAGLTSLPLAAGDQVARRMAVLYLLALCAASLLPYTTGVAGLLYLAVALALDAFFLAVAVKGWWSQLDARWARQLFFVSLLYLTGLFAVLWLDRGLR